MALKPAAWIGKAGIHDTAVAEIRKQLKKRRLVKVKFLNTFLEGHDKKQQVIDLVHRCDATLVQQVGNMVVLYK